MADALEKYPGGASSEELGSQVGINADKLARVLRLLALRGIFTEGKDGARFSSLKT